MNIIPGNILNFLNYGFSIFFGISGSPVFSCLLACIAIFVVLSSVHFLFSEMEFNDQIFEGNKKIYLLIQVSQIVLVSSKIVNHKLF